MFRIKDKRVFIDKVIDTKEVIGIDVYDDYSARKAKNVLNFIIKHHPEITNHFESKDTFFYFQIPNYKDEKIGMLVPKNIEEGMASLDFTNMISPYAVEKVITDKEEFLKLKTAWEQLHSFVWKEVHYEDEWLEDGDDDYRCMYAIRYGLDSFSIRHLNRIIKKVKEYRDLSENILQKYI